MYTLYTHTHIHEQIEIYSAANNTTVIYGNWLMLLIPEMFLPAGSVCGYMSV